MSRQVVLVIAFGREKLLQGHDLRHDRLAKSTGRLELLYSTECQLPLLGIGEKIAERY